MLAPIISYLLQHLCFLNHSFASLQVAVSYFSLLITIIIIFIIIIMINSLLAFECCNIGLAIILSFGGMTIGNLEPIVGLSLLNRSTVQSVHRGLVCFMHHLCS